MCELTSPADQDIAWLKQRMPDADENQCEAFAERVAIKFAEGMPEMKARLKALDEMKDDSNLYPPCFW